MLQIQQNLKHNLWIRMKTMKLLIEKMKLSLTHQIQLHLRNFQAKENKSKEYNKRWHFLLNDGKSLSFLI